MKLFSRGFIVPLLAIVFATGMPAHSIESDLFPAGAKLAFAGRTEIRFRINAAGPSVLWIRAEAAHLKDLRIESPEATATAEATAGAAECGIPLYSSGPVEVTLRTTRVDSAPVVVTSFYGIGDIVSGVTVAPPAASRPAAPAAPPPAPPTPTSVAAAPAPPPAAPAVSAPHVAAPVPTAPAVAPMVAPVPAQAALAPPAPAQAAPVPPAPQREVPIATAWRGIFVWDVVTGSFDQTGLETFRVYVPNRAAFDVRVTGECGIRVKAVSGSFDAEDTSRAQTKALRVTAPSEGYYYVSLKGSGRYALVVEPLR